jgi:hypothetical protein
MTMVEVYAVTPYVFAEGNILDKAMLIDAETLPTVHAELQRLRARSDAGGELCRRAPISV